MNKDKGKVAKQGTTAGLQDILLKYHYQILFLILALAFILRVMALLSMKGSVYYDFLVYDERLYHNWAKTLANGTFSSSSVYEMAPLPAYFMALIYWLLSPDILFIRLTNIIFGVLTCYIIYLIARDLSNRTAGLIACLVAALYKPFIFYSIVPLNTSMSVFLFALACLLLAGVINRGSMIRVFFLGIAICLAYNVRPNCLLLIPVIFVLIGWNAFRNNYPWKTLAMALILYASGVAAVQAPFMIRNYMKAGEASVTPSQSGLNLFICNNFKYGFPVPFATTVPSEMGVQFTIEASRRAGKKLSSSEASHYWTKEIVNSALEQPVFFAGRQVKKLLGVLNWVDKGDHYQISFVSDYVRFFKFPFLGFWLILPFGMTGLCLTMSRDRRCFALASVFITYALTLVVFFSHTRIMLPLLALLIPFAVIGVEALYSHFKNRDFKNKIIYSVVLVVFFIIEFLPFHDAKDITSYLNTHAIILNSKGLKDEAIKYWEASSKLEKHYSPYANLSLSGMYYSRGDKEKAISYLDKIGDDSYAAAQKYDMIGDVMANQSQYDKAVTAYDKALEINSGLRTTRQKLIRVLLKTDQEKAKKELETLKYINSFYTLYSTKKTADDQK